MFLFFPVSYNILPCDIRSLSVQSWQFWFLGRKKKAMMLEAYYISLRKLAAPCKLGSPSSCYEPDPVGPWEEKKSKN